MASIHIPLKGEVGSEITKDKVEELIKSDPDAKEILLEVDSLGGNVFEGFSIYNLLKNSGKKIKANIVGQCASIMTLIVSTAEVKDTTMNKPVGMWLIHNPTVGLEGDSKQLESASDTLKTIESIMVSVLKKRMKISEDEVKALMDSEKSFTPEEAQKAGLVGKIVEEMPVQKAVALFDPESLNKKDNTRLEELIVTVKQIAEKIFTKNIKNAVTLTLTDGGSIYVDTDTTPAVGDNVFTDVGMTEMVEAGDYLIDDGSLIVVGEDGVITEIKQQNDEDMNKELEAKIKEIEAEMGKTSKELKEAKAYKAKYEDLKDKVEEGMPPPSVDYTAMVGNGEGHFLDGAAKDFKKKYN